MNLISRHSITSLVHDLKIDSFIRILFCCTDEIKYLGYTFAAFGIVAMVLLQWKIHAVGSKLLEERKKRNEMLEHWLTVLDQHLSDLTKKDRK